jgi:hypothetical protein
MTYSIIQPPFTLDFQTMKKKELDGYRDWFMKVIPERIDELRLAVTSTNAFEAWNTNRTPGSLEALGEWFSSKVEIRATTMEENQEIEETLKFPIEIPDHELTNKTFSLAMDVGIYLGEVILKTIPGTKWAQQKGNKKYADYGQMIIEGLDGPAPLNPIRIVVTLAYGISRQKQDGTRLIGLYRYWTKAK